VVGDRPQPTVQRAPDSFAPLPDYFLKSRQSWLRVFTAS
jgi:hypothetical protein